MAQPADHCHLAVGYSNLHSGHAVVCSPLYRPDGASSWPDDPLVRETWITSTRVLAHYTPGSYDVPSVELVSRKTSTVSPRSDVTVKPRRAKISASYQLGRPQMTTTSATQTHRVVFRELMKDVCTSIPGHVLTFDPVTQTAQIQVGILRFDVSGASFEPPPIVHVPVSFAGSRDWVVEHEIQPGTEGMIHFSQRCIDGWCQTGGVADNPIGRFHDYSDAVFAPGIRSLPNAVPDWSNDGIRLRNREGSQFVWLKADGSVNLENGAGHIRLGADGTVTINGVTINPSGLVHTGNDVTAGSVSLKTHTHGGVDTGTGNTQGPNS